MRTTTGSILLVRAGVLLLGGVMFALVGCPKSEPGGADPIAKSGDRKSPFGASNTTAKTDRDAVAAEKTTPKPATIVKTTGGEAIAAKSLDPSGDHVAQPLLVDPHESIATPEADPRATLVARMEELNGKIFEMGWDEKPKLALLLSGRQDGYFEPCGCSGLDNQKGGLSRRHTLVKDLQRRGWEVVGLDTGGLVRYDGKQAQIKYARTIDALAQIGYQAVGFGPKDLLLGGNELLGRIVNAQVKPFVSANVGPGGIDGGFVDRFRVIDTGAGKLGVTSVLLPDERVKIDDDLIDILPAEKALEVIAPKLNEAGCWKQVLLVYGSGEAAKELARKYPQFDLVVAAGTEEEGPSRLIPIEGTDAHLAEMGHKCMYVGVVGLYDDGLMYQKVPLDARFADSPEMHQQMVDYQHELKDLGWEKLGLNPKAHPSGRKFVGTTTCAECHTSAYEVWKDTPHAHATDTLVKLDPPRQFDAECIACHATGWEPQEYFPFTSGYLGLKETPLMVQNGCENCHGPGSEHVAVEMGEKEVSREMRLALRGEMRLKLEDARDTCLKCHDFDNSPAFHAPGAFEKYWEKVKHKGKD